jgi:hypothetical protein
MATIGKVRAVFTASTSGLTSGVNAASASMRKLQSDVKGMRSSLSMLTAISGAQLFGSIASGASQAVRSLIGMGAAQAEVVDATNKMAARLGVTYGEMAGLAHAGALVDVSMETIGGAMTKADIAFVKAANGSKVAMAAFDTLGLSVESLNGMSAAERFEAIAQAISQLPTEAERSAAAVRIFGRSGVQLLPIFEQGAAGIQAARAEAERFGLTLTGAQAGNIDAMGDSFDRAKQAIAGVIQQVVAYLAPAIESVTSQFSDLIGSIGGKTIGQTIGDGILQGARFLAQIGDFLIQNLSAVWEYVSQVGGQWSSVWEIGGRVASFFAGVGDILQIAFSGIVGIFSGLTEVLLMGAKSLGDALGFDTSGLDGMLASVQGFNEGLAEGIVDNANSAAKNFNDAIFGTDEAADAGAAMAGPLTQGVDAAIAAAQAAAAQVDTATKQSVGEQKAAQAAEDQAARSREAVKGLDVRSAEGMKEWMRILREGSKPNIQERQLTVLERIEQNTADMGGDEPEVADFAPAAGT